MCKRSIREIFSILWRFHFLPSGFIKVSLVLFFSDNVIITASTTAGAFYGAQSLLSLHYANDGVISSMVVKVSCNFMFSDFRN